MKDNFNLLNHTVSPELLNYDFDSVKDRWKQPFKEFTRGTFDDMYSMGFTIVPVSEWNRSIDIKTARKFFNTDIDLYKLLQTEATKLEKKLNARTLSIVLDGLPPGGKILPHVDEAKLFQACIRVHLPLVTKPGVKFFIDGQKYYFPAGMAFRFNNQLTHSVENDSDIFRIHAVIDLLPK